MAIPGYGETIVHLVDIYIALINASLIQLDRRHTYSKPFATSWCVDAHDAPNLTSFFFWPLCPASGIYHHSQCLTILRMCGALSESHRHGDLKPNILLINIPGGFTVAVKRMGKVYYEPKCH